MYVTLRVMTSLALGFLGGCDVQKPDDTRQEEDGANDEHLLRAPVTSAQYAIDNETRDATRKFRIWRQPPARNVFNAGLKID